VRNTILLLVVDSSSKYLIVMKLGIIGFRAMMNSILNLLMKADPDSAVVGLLEFDFYTGEIRGTRHREPVDTTMTIEGKAALFGGDSRLVENFVDMVRNGASSFAPLSAGLRSVYACLAAKASAELAQFVNVSQFGH